MLRPVECRVSGGANMFSGVGERRTKGPTAFAPSTIEIQVAVPPERKYSVWIGGSILSSRRAFRVGVHH
eukprot:11218550-Lingulodinium_polyedra.AAC.1